MLICKRIHIALHHSFASQISLSLTHVQCVLINLEVLFLHVPNSVGFGRHERTISLSITSLQKDQQIYIYIKNTGECETMISHKLILLYYYYHSKCQNPNEVQYVWLLLHYQSLISFVKKKLIVSVLRVVQNQLIAHWIFTRKLGL